MAKDRANDPRRVPSIPSGVTGKYTFMELPEDQHTTAYIPRRTDAYASGPRTGVEAALSGKGKAGNMGKLLGEVKEAFKPNEDN